MPIWIGPAHNAPHPSSLLGFRQPLMNGEAGTAQTIQVMRKLVDNALNDSTFVRKAVDIVRPVAAFNEEAEVQAIFNWVRANIRFVKDPYTKEKLIPPQELLKIRSADCDCQSMLTAALAMAVGYAARWITLSTQAQSPDEFTHIFTEVEVPSGSNVWVPIDTARADSVFGVEPPMYYRKRAWDVASDRYVDLQGNMRRVKFLSGYVGMGQDGGVDWTPIVSQSIAETPAIIAAVSGRGSATSPYGSYATPYTPGYGIPQAGYVAPGTYGAVQSPFGSASFSGMMPILMVGLFAFLLLRRS